MTTDVKTKLDSILAELATVGWSPGLTSDSYQRMMRCGMRTKNLALAAVATEIALHKQPLTLRGLFYQCVSAGMLPATDKKHYDRLGRVMTKLREAGIVPFSWIVDNMRQTVKPPSWSGLGDFVETVRNSYRLDFWERLADYVHIFCEKDAIAGVIAPVTREFDVRLSPLRGYSSLSFAHGIADLWNRIRKPIFAYYLGDFDPSGFDIERDLREKLSRYCGGADFAFARLGVLPEDFTDFNLLPLDVKTTDKRSAKFLREHGERCAEVDAIPADELRRRVREAIESHIPQDEWDRLQQVEQVERESFTEVLEQWAS